MFALLRTAAAIGTIAWFSPVWTSAPVAGGRVDPLATIDSVTTMTGNGQTLTLLWQALPEPVKKWAGDQAVAALTDHAAPGASPSERAVRRSRDTLTLADRQMTWRGPVARGG